MSLTAILLAAGYATRLYPLTTDRPKALLPLGEGVILDPIYAELGADVTQRILVTNSRFSQQFLDWREARGISLEILDDGTTGPETRLGAIRDLELARVRAALNGDLLVIGTDNLFAWSLAAFIEIARRHHPHPSVALWEAPLAMSLVQFGVVTVDATSRMTALIEKSPTPPSRLVATCVYYFPQPVGHAIRQFIEAGGNTDAPGYFIKWLVERGAVYGITMPGSWYDIGTLEAYQQLLNEWPVRTSQHPTSR